MIRSLCFFAFLTLWLPGVQAQESPQQADPAKQQEFQWAVANLMDAALRMDLPGLEFARQRFKALTVETALAAEAYYFTAFADWQLAMNNFADPDKAKAYVKEGFAHLEKVFQKDPDHGYGRLLMLRLYFWQVQLAPEEAPNIWPQYGQALSKVRTLIPEHPLTVLNLGLATYYPPNNLKEKGIQLMEQAVAGFAEAQDPADPHGAFWYMLGSAWLGNHYMMADTPRVADARAVYQHALKVRPDYAMIRDMLMPATETLVTCAASEVAGLKWKTLAEDKAGDGADASLADGKALAMALDPEKDMVWFRFSFHRMPSEDGFGVNLVVDNDGDAQNGSPWWGGNRNFHFDQLFSVWVARGSNGELTGTVGIGSAAEVLRGRMTGLARNNISFTRDESEQTIIIGFQRKWLGRDDKVRLIGAVGSNSRWNDDLPDDRVLELDLDSVM